MLAAPADNRPPLREDRKRLFLEKYRDSLASYRMKFPERYAWPLEQLEEIVERIGKAIDDGTYNVTARAARAACRALGIRESRVALETFLTRPNIDDARKDHYPKHNAARRHLWEAYPENQLDVLYRLLAVAGRHNLQVVISDRYATVWDGLGRIRLRRGMRPVAMASYLAHELAHYALSTPIMRKLPDYGLGSSPDTRIELPIKHGLNHSLLNEEIASILGMAIESWAGQDPFVYTWDDHNWPSRNYEDSYYKIWHYVRILRRFGHIEEAPYRRRPARFNYMFREVEGPGGFEYSAINHHYDPFRDWKIPFCESKE